MSNSLFNDKSSLFGCHSTNGLGFAHLSPQLVSEYPIYVGTNVNVGDQIAVKVPHWTKEKKIIGYEIITGIVKKISPKLTPRSFIEIQHTPRNTKKITRETLYFGDAHRKNIALSGIDPSQAFVNALQIYFNSGDFLSQKTIKEIAGNEGIFDTTIIKELYETALLLYVKSLNLDSSKKSFDKIVEIYNKQISLNLRTSNSVMLQQYSTPIPLAWLAGVYVRHNQPKYTVNYFEPSAGNGFLTIALRENQTIVNEIDKTRRANLEKFHDFLNVTNYDASKFFPSLMSLYNGIITNPPFGSVSPLEFGTEKRFKISKLEHVMTIHALDTMKDSGRAAIIIGGHTEWDSYGKVRNGADRYFLSYLHHYYNVEDVINIKGDMYAKQGTRFPIRLILINGRKAQPEGTAPLKTVDDWTVNNWTELWNRISHYITIQNEEITLSEMRRHAERLRLANEEAKMMLEILAMETEMGLGGITDLRIIDAPKHNFKNIKEAKIWAKAHIAGTYLNVEFAHKIRISNSAIDKYLSEKAVKKSYDLDAHLSALKILPELIRNAVILERHPDRDNSPFIKEIIRFFCGINYENDIYSVKITVKAYHKGDSKAYSYEVMEIETH